MSVKIAREGEGTEGKGKGERIEGKDKRRKGKNMPFPSTFTIFFAVAI